MNKQIFIVLANFLLIGCILVEQTEAQRRPVCEGGGAAHCGSDGTPECNCDGSEGMC